MQIKELIARLKELNENLNVKILVEGDLVEIDGLTLAKDSENTKDHTIYAAIKVRK